MPLQFKTDVPAFSDIVLHPLTPNKSIIVTKMIWHKGTGVVVVVMNDTLYTNLLMPKSFMMGYVPQGKALIVAHLLNKLKYISNLTLKAFNDEQALLTKYSLAKDRIQDFLYSANNLGLTLSATQRKACIKVLGESEVQRLCPKK